MRGNMYSTIFPPILLFCLTVIVIVLRDFWGGEGVDDWHESAQLLRTHENADSHDDSQRLCVHSEGDFVKQGNILPVGSLLDNNTTQICPKATDFCFILWQEHPKNKSMLILHQGCWESTDVSCKHNECIALKRPSKARNYTKFCCCEGNFCNINITDGYLKEFDPPEPDFAPVDHMPYTMQIVIAAIVLIVCVMFAIITCFLTRIYCATPKRSNESLHLMEAPPPVPSNFDLDTLKIQNALARGRYGTVYLGSLNDQSVAVKIFSYQNRQHFLNERDIYTLPHMNHASLPKYIGSEERTGDDGRPEYLLVVSFSPIGCLQDYLRENVIDWNQLCKMTLSITRGLAHLHTEFKSGDKLKPCIAHRDVTSRNIIVKPDGTCMLCDFGFAIRLCGSKYILNGEEQVAEETSLADVGTLRYMAPEILEGAVNLRDCESSLKQTDVYALGLVMWEIASRCSDLFQGVEVPPYKQPFEAEVGLDPTMEQMQSLVAKLKARPLFPDIWKGTNPAIRSLKETIEDCWDQDAEARLTTLCVKERIMELPVLWERYKAGLGIPEGISPNSTFDLHGSSELEKKSCTYSDLGLDITDQDQLIIPRERTNSVSECTTETLLSPSTNDTNLKNFLNSNDSSATKFSVPLQPHQGCNPCLARNLMQEQSDDLPVIGNVLHNDNSKYISDQKIYSFSDGDANIFSLPNGMQSSLLASSDHINHSNRVCNPIPYVQNHIHFPSIIPKQGNIPANIGSKDLFKKDEKRWGPFRYFGRKNAKGSIRAGLKILLDRKASVSNGYLPEEQQPLKNSGISSPISPNESNRKQGQINPVNSFWTCNEVRETDHTVNREVKTANPGGSVPLARPLNNNSEKVEDQGNILKNDSQLLNGYVAVIDDKENNPCVSPDYSTENKIEQREKSKRPTTLPVQSFNDDQDDEELLEISNSDISKESVNEQVVQQENTDSKTVPIRRKGSGNKRKGVKRVKTPFEIKGRFSLYDDRIMSSQELPTGAVDCTSDVMQPQLDNTKFSASVPLNMNTLCLTSQASSTLPSDQTEEMKYHKADKERPLNGSVAPVSCYGHQNIISLCDI